MNHTHIAKVPVVIVGGGPVGLSASILLSRYGIEHLLVEKNAQTAVHPKATVVNSRTMEIFRQWGIEAKVREQGVPQHLLFHMRWLDYFNGRELANYSLLDSPERLFERMAIGPAMAAICPQDLVEPILLEKARSFTQADIRFGWECVDFKQSSSEVELQLHSEANGQQTIQAQYVIAADGAASPIREALGIALEGPTRMGSVLNIYFHADLSAQVEARPAFLYWLVNPKVNGVLIALDGKKRWLFNFFLKPHEHPSDYTNQRLEQLLLEALALPDVSIELQNMTSWWANNQVAIEYRAGRIFLAGDAAHRFPPTGGFGMNSGIQDVHNLSWKIAAVLQGWAGSALLNSYQAERKPVARSNGDFSTHNLNKLNQNAQNQATLVERIANHDPSAIVEFRAGLQGASRHVDASNQEMGYIYQSTAVMPSDSGPPRGEDPITDYIPSAYPGARAAHIWLHYQNKLISSLDLYDGKFVLLTQNTHPTWESLAVAAKAQGIPFQHLVVGRDIRDASPLEVGLQRLQSSRNLNGKTRSQLLQKTLSKMGLQRFLQTSFKRVRLTELYGLSKNQAVLVRPDGHVAWRGDASQNIKLLEGLTSFAKPSLLAV